jgi:hypothetical protein
MDFERCFKIAIFNRGWYQWEEVGTKKGGMRVNMVEGILYPYMKINE